MSNLHCLTSDIGHRTSDIDPFHAEGAAGEADDDPGAIRAATMLPAQLLQPGEIIVLLLKPSPWFILLAPLKTVTILLVVTALAMLVNQYVGTGIAQRELVLMGAVLIGLRLFWQFAEWLARVYVLTDQRVIRVRGVLRVSVFECRLAQVQQTDLVFTVRERLFGLGTISFSTAATVSEAYWLMVERPLDVHQKVVATINRYRR